MMIVNGLFDYKVDQFSGRESSCYLRVYEMGDGIFVAIATELADNKGPSVTNSAEGLWSEVVKEYGLEPTKTHFVEHYPHHGRESETYDFVELHWYDGNTGACHPKWKHSTRKEIETLIGESLS